MFSRSCLSGALTRVGACLRSKVVSDLPRSVPGPGPGAARAYGRQTAACGTGRLRHLRLSFQYRLTSQRTAYSVFSDEVCCALALIFATGPRRLVTQTLRGNTFADRVSAKYSLCRKRRNNLKKKTHFCFLRAVTDSQTLPLIET